MGDFNINLLRSETCNYAQNFLLSLQSFNLMPTIDKPTRVHNNSATLIDNSFVNQLGNNDTSGNIVSDISDHYSQFCITHLKTKLKALPRTSSWFGIIPSFLRLIFSMTYIARDWIMLWNQIKMV